MNLKQQRNIGYGLLGFGLALMTGFSLSAYGQWIIFLGAVILIGITLAFLAAREAVELKGKSQEMSFQQCLGVTGTFFGLIFLGYLVVVTLGVIKGF